MSEITLTRRSRIQAVMTTTPGTLTRADAKPMTLRQFATEYRKLRRLVGNSTTIFMAVYHKGRRIHPVDVAQLVELVEYPEGGDTVTVETVIEVVL